MTKFNEYPVLSATPESDDTILIHDDSAGSLKQISYSYFSNSNTGARKLTNQSSNITLDSNSAKVQSLGFDDNGYSLILPDATTIEEGFVYVVHNNNDYNFGIIRNNDIYLADIFFNQCYLITLFDNSTSAGIWGAYGFDNIITAFAFGKVSIFNSSNSSEISVVALSDSKAIVCYQDNDNSNSGMACVLDISGSTITEGTPTVFNSTKATDISVSKLSDSKAIICYRDYYNSYSGTACVLDISGSTITAGTLKVFNSANSTEISVSKLSDSKAIVCYRDFGNSGYGTACVLDISGSTITAGTSKVFNSASSPSISVSKLSDSKAIVCYQDSNNADYGTACVLDISGSTITEGTPKVFNSAKAAEISVVALSDSKAIVCYQDYGNSYSGTACVLNISGSTITEGTPKVFESANSISFSVVALSDSKAIVCYRDNDNSNYGTACMLDILSSTITAGIPEIFKSVASYYISGSKLSDSKAIVCYQDCDNLNYGIALCINLIE